MSDPTELPESDLDTQLRGLFQEAEQKIQGRAAATARPDAEREVLRAAEERVIKAYTSLPQMLRPMVLGLEAVSRAAGDNAVLLQKIDRAATEAADAHGSLPQLIAGLESLLDQKNGVNQRMFDALHEELKGYKDGFLMESVLKPIVRDLVSLYDDLSTIHRQMQDCVTAVAGAGVEEGSALGQQFRTMEMNLEHHCEFVVEILARLEVTMLPIGTGKLDKQLQRAVSIEMAEDPDDDMTVVRTVKRGFQWKERLLRPEEVVMRKWKEGFLIALPNPSNSQK